MTRVVGRELRVQNIPKRICCHVLLPFPDPWKEMKLTESILPWDLCLPFLLLLTQVCLCEGWECAARSPLRRVLVTSAETYVNEETGSLVVRLLHTPGLGQPPTSPSGAGVPTPLPLREDVKVKMPKSREKVEQNQTGVQSVTELVA